MRYKKKPLHNPRAPAYRITRTALTTILSPPQICTHRSPPIICAIHDFNRPPFSWADSLIAARRIMLRSRKQFSGNRKEFLLLNKKCFGREKNVRKLRWYSYLIQRYYVVYSFKPINMKCFFHIICIIMILYHCMD